MSDNQVVEQQAQEDQKTMDIETAKKVLGLSQEFTGERALQFFEVSHWVALENGEIEIIPDLILAKNVILRNIVSEQMRTQRYFKIVSPFDHSCRSCHGTGEIYKFESKSVEVTCHICGGKGQRWIKCPSCKGTGRYKVRWKEGGGINVECRRCLDTKGTDHEFEILVDCLECNREGADGKKKATAGKKLKVVKSHVIESTTPCKYCNQLGFTENLPHHKTRAFRDRQKLKRAKRQQTPKPKRSFELGTPVIDCTLAEKIKEQIDQQGQCQDS